VSGGRLRALVCGSTFGQFYLNALAARPDAFEIVGLLGRGSARSRDCARRFGVPLFRDPAELPEGLDLACVVVRSAVLGGAGGALAHDLLGRGIAVVQEQPVHHDDLAQALRLAHHRGVPFRLGNLYLHLPAVRRFIAAARAARREQEPLFLDVACASQVAFPMLQILAEALGGLRPWSLTALTRAEDGPFQLVGGRLGGIPLTLRVQNEVDPADPDNHLHLLHRLLLGFPGGTLALADTHGPLLWHPRLHVPATVKDRLDFAAAPDLAEPASQPLAEPAPPSLGHQLADVWPRAIGADLLALRTAILTGGDRSGEAALLTVCRVWQDLTGAIGYPALRPGAPHRPLPAAVLREAVAALDSPVAGRDGAVAGCVEAVEPLLRSLAAEKVPEFVARLDAAVLSAMASALWPSEGTVRKGARWHADEILARTHTAPRHHRLVRRWLDLLVERGWLRRDGSSLIPLRSVTSDDVARAWDQAEAAWSEGLGGPVFIDYLRRHVEHLPRLMSDDLHPALLLFPEGRIEPAAAIYRETLPARYLNGAVAEAARRIAADGRRALGVIEVGGGTGATTEVVAPVLDRLVEAGVAVDYLFTDISRFFLDPARARFGRYSWMRFGQIDVDRDPLSQGARPGAADVVIAAGVLNNAADLAATLRGLAALLAEGGWLLIVEPTREHLEILISQAFMMTPPRDGRCRSGVAFLSPPEWRAALAEAGLDAIVSLPAEDHPLAPLGQRLFLARRPVAVLTPTPTPTPLQGVS